MNIEKKVLIELYDLVYNNTHSDGYKACEMEDLLTNVDYYWFIEKPNENWKENLNSRLLELGFPEYYINKKF